MKTYSDIELDDILWRWYHGAPEQQEHALKDLRKFIDTNWEQDHIRDKSRHSIRR
jgi:hypothetical protein